MKHTHNRLKLRTFVLLVMGLLPAFNSYSADNDFQTITITVSAINELSVSGTPSLTINTATAGSQPTLASDSTSTYSVTTNASSTPKRITAQITTGTLPTGLTLTVELANGLAETALSTASAVDVRDGISQALISGQTITYRATALVTTPIGTVSPSPIVTFTLVDDL